MNKLTLLIALSAFLCAAPGYTAGRETGDMNQALGGEAPEEGEEEEEIAREVAKIDAAVQAKRDAEDNEKFKKALAKSKKEAAEREAADLEKGLAKSKKEAANKRAAELLRAREGARKAYEIMDKEEAADDEPSLEVAVQRAAARRAIAERVEIKEAALNTTARREAAQRMDDEDIATAAWSHRPRPAAKQQATDRKRLPSWKAPAAPTEATDRERAEYHAKLVAKQQEFERDDPELAMAIKNSLGDTPAVPQEAELEGKQKHQRAQVHLQHQRYRHLMIQTQMMNHQNGLS